MPTVKRITAAALRAIGAYPRELRWFRQRFPRGARSWNAVARAVKHDRCHEWLIMLMVTYVSNATFAQRLRWVHRISWITEPLAEVAIRAPNVQFARRLEALSTSRRPALMMQAAARSLTNGMTLAERALCIIAATAIQAKKEIPLFIDPAVVSGVDQKTARTWNRVVARWERTRTEGDHE